MIIVSIEPLGDTWFAVAEHGGRLVATATGSDEEDATRYVIASLPRGAEHRIADEATPFARATMLILARLISGEPDTPAFELCPDCVREPLASVAHVASSIPRGYVTTYGAVADAAATEARVVGHIMATNPLYPIIPCHRVVGADFSLVGYAGSRGPASLHAKLDRLRAEAHGAALLGAVPTPLPGKALPVFPAERVLSKAIEDGLDDGGQLSLW